MTRRWSTRGWLGLALPFVILVTLWFSLGLHRSNFGVPINYRGDTLWFAVIVKAMQTNGWVYHVPQLGAPYSLSAVLFPAASHFDWAVMKGLTLFFSTPGGVLNAFFLFSLVAAGVTAYASFTALGIRTWLSFAMAFLYALLPFAFGRNIAHICLTYFLVPPVCLLCLHVLRGDQPGRFDRIAKWGIAFAFMQGLDYVYPAFFCGILLGFTILITLLQRGARRRAWVPAVALAALLAGTVLNFLPSVLEWRAEGKPQGLEYKSPREAEIYAFKLRRLLAPHAENAVPGLDYWGSRDVAAGFPNENENQTARLGVFGMVALLSVFVLGGRRVLLGTTDRTSSEGPALLLTGICLLFGTVGGLGAVFSELTVPDIRGYNRISVFVSFLASVAFGAWLSRRLTTVGSRSTRAFGWTAIAVVVALSTYDQLLDARSLARIRATDVASSRHYDALLAGIESVAGTNGSDRPRVFMLPTTGFPADPGVEAVAPYEHAYAYLASSKLDWSWPALSDRQVAWSNEIEKLDGEPLLLALAHSGFDYLWINTAGYVDRGAGLLRFLASAGIPALASETDPTIRVFDLRSNNARILREEGGQAFRQQRRRLLEQPLLRWGNGFYAAERAGDGGLFRWSQQQSAVEVRNFTAAPMQVTLSASLQGGNAGEVRVTTPQAVRSIVAGPAAVPLAVELTVPAQGRALVSFAGTMPRVDAPGDARTMYFNLKDVRVSESARPGAGSP